MHTTWDRAKSAHIVSKRTHSIIRERILSRKFAQWHADMASHRAMRVFRTLMQSMMQAPAPRPCRTFPIVYLYSSSLFLLANCFFFQHQFRDKPHTVHEFYFLFYLFNFPCVEVNVVHRLFSCIPRVFLLLLLSTFFFLFSTCSGP